MFWRKDAETEKKLKQMNELLKKSFANVKKDTTNIFQWLNYFYRKNIEQEQAIKQLRMELSYIPKTRDEIRQIIDNYYSFDGIFAKIRELDEKVDSMAEMKAQADAPQVIPKEMQAYINGIERRISALEQKKASIKEKIIRRLARNSKEYVKSVIISYIKKYERASALQLKEMVVDEQNFCSKSSFYRILEEIEGLEDIGIIRQGKEKHYIAKALSGYSKQKSI